MKSIFSIALLLAGLVAGAQKIDRTKAPKPGPAPVINIGEPASFTLPNGLRVFVVTHTKLPQVSVTLTLDRDPIFEGDKAGLEGIAGSLMRRGTTTMNKAQLDEAVDFLGASLDASSVSVFGNSLKNNFPQLMKLMADIVLRPAFAADELEKVRTQTLSNLQSQKDDPATIGRRISSMLVYGKTHPYGEFETEASVKKITAEDARAYHATWWKPNIAYLIFIGDITPAEAEKLATENFGSWTKGEVPKNSFPAPALAAKRIIAIVDRPASVQSTINLAAPIQLQPGAPDAIPASVMNNILGTEFSSRLMQNLREKYGFTYGARSALMTDKLVGRFSAGAAVRNEKTDSAIGQFIYEFERIRNNPVSDSELTVFKNLMSGSFARSLEEPSTIAGFALNTAVYNLPNDYYRNYLTRLSAVRKEEVKAMAEKYVPVNNLIITIVGNAKEITPGLEKYGEIKYFDVNGNPVVPKKLDANLKPEDVFRKAIEAYGGEATLANIKDVTLSGEVSMMGQQLGYIQKHVLPDGVSRNITMGGMNLMSEKKAGTQYSQSQQGQPVEMSAADKEDLDAQAMLFEERQYLTKTGYKPELKGITNIDGEDAYHIALTKPGGGSVQLYYSVASGMLLQQETERDLGQAGKTKVVTKILEYTTEQGIKLPKRLSIDAGMFKQEVEIKEIKINQGLKLTDL